MDVALRDLVSRRAGQRCEYCLMPQDAMPYMPLHIEHVVARQHRGPTSAENLALACNRCNAFKGTNLSSIDPTSGEAVRLFHPRTDSWHDHFSIVAGEIFGTTPIGRATAELLNMNEPERMELRAVWLVDGSEIP